MNIKIRPKKFAKTHWLKVLENLEASKKCLENEHYNASISRSYYAVYQTLATILIANGHFRETKRHIDVIYDFHKNYVTNEDKKDIYKIIPKEWKILSEVLKLKNYRHLADYESVEASEEESKYVLKRARTMIYIITHKFKKDNELEKNFKEIFQ